jgi:hypothetical protein
MAMNDVFSHKPIVFYILSDSDLFIDPLLFFCLQAYEKACESVHYQNVVLKRGTMNK